MLISATGDVVNLFISIGNLSTCKKILSPWKLGRMVVTGEMDHLVLMRFLNLVVWMLSIIIIYVRRS